MSSLNYNKLYLKEVTSFKKLIHYKSSNILCPAYLIISIYNSILSLKNYNI